MSALLNSLKQFENQCELWRPYGEKFIALDERGASMAEISDMIQLVNPHQSITVATTNLLLFLEGDRHSLMEGWERLQTASHLSNIDLEARFASSEVITDDEMLDLFKNAAEVKKYGSKAAHIWTQLQETKPETAFGFNGDCVARVFQVFRNCLSNPATLAVKDFASLDLKMREAFFILAKKNSDKLPNDFVPWVKRLPKSPEISNFHLWPAATIPNMV